MSNRRLFWRIVDKIEAGIDSGDYQPGNRLPSERELAETYNVSRPTIREAIIALEVREKVEVKTGSGVYVLELVNQNGPITDINAFEITQARALIEGEVAASAASSITPEELEQLEKTLFEMETTDNIQAVDHEFHYIIAKATRNNAMILSVENLWALRTSTTEVIKDYDNVCSKDDELTLQEHKEIYEALKLGDSGMARIAMHKHFNRLINTLFEAVEKRTFEEVKRLNNEKRGLYSIDNIVNHRH